MKKKLTRKQIAQKVVRYYSKYHPRTYPCRDGRCPIGKALGVGNLTAVDMHTPLAARFDDAVPDVDGIPSLTWKQLTAKKIVQIAKEFT